MGNKNTHKFHYESCGYVQRMNESNKIYIQARQEAISKSYEPCKQCNP
ncbi:MAG: hypothetical protein LBT79_02830 [Elusimicrobiota bacterium]|nr:hypothetical protein [Elusimicrobiota bacterium]